MTPEQAFWLDLYILGQKVGIAIGCIALLVVIGTCVYCICRGRELPDWLGDWN